MIELKLDEMVTERNSLYNSVKLSLKDYLKAGGGAIAIAGGATGMIASAYFGTDAFQNQHYWLSATCLFTALGNLALANMGREWIQEGIGNFRTRRDVEVTRWENRHFDELMNMGYFDNLLLDDKLQL